MTPEIASDLQRRQRLADLRRNAGFSQESLAEHLQASRSSIYRWERGEADPHPRQLVKWADALRIEADELNEILWSDSISVHVVDEGQTGPDRHSTDTAEGEVTEDPSRAADIVDLTDTGHESLSVENAIVRLLGLDYIPTGERPAWRIAVAMPSFQGSNSIRTDTAEGAPASYVQAADDISNDFFFGKRDVVLSNQIASALTKVGFGFPLYVDDKAVWRQMEQMVDDQDDSLTIEHEGDTYAVDMLVVVGLWSNLLATALADWTAFPEYQMTGDPNRHFTRTIRIASESGLRIVDLNASDESDEMGGNPAILINQQLANLHVVVAGGATSLSTLRLSELLTRDEIWIELAKQVERTSDGYGSWLALECPNAARWKDRCRIVGSGPITTTVDKSIADAYRQVTTRSAEYD